MSSMRAKFIVTGVTPSKDGDGNVVGERLQFAAVCKADGYPADGSDEDNTFAKFSPSASCEIYVANPALFGKHQVGEKYYVDFTKAGE